MDRSGALKAFASLASGARLDIFCQLVSAGPDGLVAGEIARALGTPANNVSFHLKTMRAAGLVNAIPEGRFLRYRADVPHMLRLLAYVTENCCFQPAAKRGKNPSTRRTACTPS